jgi:hypothetical protein
MATAAELISRAWTLLLDGGSRYTESAMLANLNEAIVEAVALKPDLNLIETAVTLGSGPRQELPADGLLLERIIRNETGQRIEIINPDVLAMQDPEWGSRTGTVVTHAWADPKDHKVFYVYPAAAGEQIRIQYAAGPDALTATTESVPLDGTAHGALVDYLVYRALSIDDDAGDKATAQTAYKSFLAKLGARDSREEHDRPRPGGAS